MVAVPGFEPGKSLYEGDAFPIKLYRHEARVIRAVY